MTDLIPSLIERLKAAEGPSRELDAEIMFDLFAKPVGKKDDGGPTGYLWPEDNSSWSFGIRFPGKDREWFGKRRKESDGEILLVWRDNAYVLMNDLRIPALTASLDATIALVERKLPGMAWTIGQNVHHRTWGASLNELSPEGEPRSIAWGQSSQPALALLIALLTALQEQEEGRG